MAKMQERLRVFVDEMAMTVTMARGGRKPSWGCLRRTFFFEEMSVVRFG